MVLLNGHSLTSAGKLDPESLSLTLEERKGSATITLGKQNMTVSFNAWLKDNTEPGNGIVWRVKTSEDSYQTETRSITLEHLIQCLRDTVIFGSAKAEDMGGGSTIGARAAINWALAKQSDWVLGSFDYDSVSNPYDFSGRTVYEAIETVSSTLADAWWSYDFSVYPFRLNITAKPSTVAAEMRGNRNMTSVRKTVDRSGMYTRIYPIGKDDLHLSEVYLSKNVASYGLVAHIETDETMDTEEKLRAWANERLNRHAEPRVTVTVSGLELSESTGEPLDKLTLGKMCQVPMPEFSTTITERIVKLQWRDKISDPETVTVTLANTMDDVASILNREASSTSTGGRRGAVGAKQNAEDHAWFVDTTDHVAMVAEAVAGEGAAEDWSRVAQVLVDGQGVHQRVTKAEGDIVTNTASIEMVENQVAIVVDANGNVKPVKIVAAINNGSSSLLLSADHVSVDGHTAISSLLTGQASVIALKVDDLQIRGAYGMPYIPVANCINVATVSGNELKLYNMAGELVATFSKATSLSGAWGGTGNTYIVTAKQNGSTVGTDQVTVSYRFNASSGQYYLEGVYMKPGDSNWTPLLNTSTTYKLGTNAAGTEVQIQNSSGNQYPNTPTLAIATYSSSASLTRQTADPVSHVTKGVLYWYNTNSGQYTALGDANTYWYTSYTNIGATKTVHYN